LLYVAGHETTVNLIGNGFLALLRHPAESARLVADPSVVPAAVEELLRFDGPVHRFGRIATVDVELGARLIPAGCPAARRPARAPARPRAHPPPRPPGGRPPARAPPGLRVGDPHLSRRAPRPARDAGGPPERRRPLAPARPRHGPAGVADRDHPARAGGPPRP